MYFIFVDWFKNHVSIPNLIDWIEKHEHTVDLLKAITLVVIAWLTGGFTYLRNLTRKPRLEICKTSSICLSYNMEHLEKENLSIPLTSTMTAYLLDIAVINPTNNHIVIRQFALQYRPQYRSMFLWRRWSQVVSSISLPNRVRFEMGSGTKILRNWFAIFPDEFDSTALGKIDAMDTDSGFSLFQTATFGSHNPRIKNNFIKVRLQTKLVSGEKLTAYAKVQVINDKDFFERMVPDVIDHIEHTSSWNVPLRR